MSKELLEAILEDGVRNTHFFNGRLLSAADLTTEQEANRTQRQLLGRAIGDGIAYGFEVQENASTAAESTSTRPVVNIAAGLAVNRDGQTLYLPADTELALVRESDEAEASAGLFAPCEPPQSTAVLTGTGVYILVVTPASGYLGSAPVSGLGGSSTTSCNHKYAIEGVQFRLLELDVTKLSVSLETRNRLTSLMASGTTDDTSKLRNLLAHVCLGTEETVIAADPFTKVADQYPFTNWGALDTLRSLETLTDCDVPLALLYWTASGLQFTDMWSVRRRIAAPAGTNRWSIITGDRRTSENEAMLLQFEEHIEAIRTTETDLPSLVATDRFDYLPPVGFLPLTGTGTASGMSYTTFFSDQPYAEPVAIDGARIAALIRSGLGHPPVNAKEGEMVRLFYARDEATPTFMIFTTGYIEYDAEARFDVSLWDGCSFS